MTVDNLNPSVEKSNDPRNIKRILLAVMPLGTLGGLFFTYLAWQTNVWQLYVLGIAAGTPVVIAMLSFLLVRQGRIRAGTWLILISILIVLTIGPVLFKGIGPLLGIGALFLAAFIAGQTLPAKQVERVILMGAGVGALDVLADVFGPDTRLEASQTIIVGLSVLLAITGLVLGFTFFRQFGNYSLRVKLIAAFALIGILSTAGSGFMINNRVQSELTQEVGDSLNSQARAQALSIGNDMAKQVELMRTLGLNEKLESTLNIQNEQYTGSPAEIQAEIDRLDLEWRAADAANNNNDPLVKRVLANSLGTELLSFRAIYPAHVEVFVTDVHGAIVAATNRTSDYNQADESWWQSAFNGGKGSVYFGPPEYDESTFTYSCNIAIPLFNKTRQIIGVLRTTYALTALAQNLANARFGETGEATLIFSSGEILDSNGNRSSLDSATLSQVKAATGRYGQFIYLGNQRIVSSAPIVSTYTDKDAISFLGWVMTVEQDPTEALHPVRTIGQTTLLISLVTLIVISALAAIGGQFLSGPIVRLTKVAEQVRAGDLDSRARVESHDEIGTLAETFNATTEQLQATLQGLEQRVAERTTEMEMRSLELADRTVALELANIRTQKRAAQFQAISDVSRTIAAVRNVTDILPRITKVVSERFGFYHVGIFLMDEANQYAILGAANSEGGQRMLARGHRLKVGAQGIVGYVTATGKPRIALDTGADAVFFNNPDLPGTHSEMAVPLKSGEKVIGALDVQSEQANAFTQEDADVIQTLADQVSIAIENARLFDATQKSLSESETMYRQYVRQEWKRLATNEKLLGFRYNLTGTVPLERLLETKDIKQATETGETLIETAGQSDQAALSVPIKLRDEVIGMLNIRTPGKRAWSQDEISLVQAVADRVAVSAENARLFDETTHRAERERTVSEITSKIRGTNDPNEMIQIAIHELKQALQVKDARIVPYNPPAPKGEN